MAALTVYEIVRAGVTPTYVAAAGGGDTFVNDGATFVHVKNGDASGITVTITATGKVQGIALSDLTVTVAATSEEMIGPFPQHLFNSGTTGVSVGYSAVTSVTVAAMKLGNS